MLFKPQVFWHTLNGAACYVALIQPLVRPSIATISSQAGTCTFRPPFSQFFHTTSPVSSIDILTMVVDHNKTVNDRFTFPGLPNLVYGQKFEPQYSLKAGKRAKSWNSDKDAAKRQFQPLPGVYRARDLIAMFSPCK